MSLIRTILSYLMSCECNINRMISPWMQYYCNPCMATCDQWHQPQRCTSPSLIDKTTWDTELFNNMTRSLSSLGIHDSAVIFRQHRPENMATSPLGIGVMYAAANIGARGRTKNKLDELIGVDITNKIIANLNEANFKQILGNLNRDDIQIYNSFFINTNHHLSDDSHRQIWRSYGIQTYIYNLTNAEQAVRDINSDILSKTKQRVQNFMKSDDLTITTDFLFTSATYFRPQWKSAFEDAPENENKSFFGYLNYQKFFIIPLKEIDADHQLKMVIITNSTDSDGIYLDDFVKMFDKNSKIETYISNSVKEIGLIFPTIRLETKINLRSYSSGLKAHSIFYETADYQGIVSPENYSPMRKEVTMDLIQKVVIEIESGACFSVGCSPIDTYSLPIMNTTNMMIFDGRVIPFAVIIISDQMILAAAQIPDFPVRIENRGFKIDV